MVGQRYSHLNGCTSDDIADDLLMQIRKSGSMGHFQLDYTDCTEVRGQYFLFSTLTSWHSLSAETIYRNRFCKVKKLCLQHCRINLWTAVFPYIFHVTTSAASSHLQAHIVKDH